MQYQSLGYLVHGGDYNPDQWIKTPAVWDEDMRLMKLAHINSATVGIFAWSLLEPAEGEYRFGWLDTVMDKLAENGIGAVLATPSAARPAWLAQKYPEVLRVNENGVRIEFGGRNNHCLTSPVYREKVRAVNERLAERYQDHPALRMWHISNEYSGACFCPLCRQAFREWLKTEYGNNLGFLNEKWWNGFWSHRYTDWEQIVPPSPRSDLEVPALRLAWSRFVSDSHISFYENEIAPLREYTPAVPVTTNLMRMYDGIDYQKLASRMDLVSWDNYPDWEHGDNEEAALETAFVHDAFRSMKNGQPFFMMESTPSIVNHKPINKLPRPGLIRLAAMQAVAHGADSVQYFQWRKSRGGHEKYHGAVVDHCGRAETRVFREVAETGAALVSLAPLAGTPRHGRVAVIYDWENAWAVKYFCGFNNLRRDYFDECKKWYRPFWRRGICVDVIPMDADFSGYACVLAPFLYMLKDGTAARIADYVKNGGVFLGTYLTGMADRDDLCFLGGVPAGVLKEVFCVWHEETDALDPDRPGRASFLGKSYPVEHICDIIHSTGARTLGRYESDFYSGEPAVTENRYGAGAAYYAAFRSDGDFADDLCGYLMETHGIAPGAAAAPAGVSIQTRGAYLFLMNFSDDEKHVSPGGGYTDAFTGARAEETVALPPCGYRVLRKDGSCFRA